MSGAYVAIFLLLFVVLTQQRKQWDESAAMTVLRKRKQGGKTTMSEMILPYIGKDCIVYTLGNTQVTGVIREVRDGWLRIDNGKDSDAVNLDYVIRVREYPTNKKGKRAAIVTD